MTAIPFRRELTFTYGDLEEVAPNIRRIIAHNPSPFTFHGTGTYVIGRGEVAVIDAGPRDAAHVYALLTALEGETITHQLITHTHLDHSPAAALVKEATGAPTYGYGPHGAARAADGVVVEEGGDMDFVPDHRLGDGDTVNVGGLTIRAIHTPGHTSNHLCFALEDTSTLFTGDHVMGWSTTVVSPPDGDMRAYMASLDKLLARDDEVYWPTHGPAIDAPGGFVRTLIAHREAREAAILSQVSGGIGEIRRLVEALYADVDTRLHPAAARSVHAHLVKLHAEGRVTADGPATLEATYRPG